MGGSMTGILVLLAFCMLFGILVGNLIVDKDGD